MREFLYNCRQFGFGVAVYNALFMWLHRHDAHVRVWREGESCPGCDNCGKAA